MPRRVLPADLSRVKTYPLAERASKVRVDEFGRAVNASSSLGDFLDGLPDVLAAKVLRELAAAVVQARAEERPVAVALGAHVVKVGLAPVLIALMEEKIVTSLAMTGAGAIHDWEIAAIGATSEDVGRGLHAGRFGMAEETGRALNDAAREAAASGSGFGETLGRRIVAEKLPHRAKSLLARAFELEVPVTVHVAIGSDIVHQHPSADGGAIGAATFTDFRKLVTLVGELAGGVWINLGSAVQLPEVFLKALSIAENLGHDVRGFATANLDMIRHYRTDENVLRRPTLGKGTSFALTGHHEINVPLLAAAIGLERARRESGH
ncbi:MAG TPA: hypothetical protein VFV19_14435 [Candidatus Polarisedimenticolaceae bacterium]|nr:hypothetical protein [Candidatus Polarisedimenticolaceae bacterium]